MRKCLWCGATDGITRDHVVSRMTLKLALGRDEYARFCSLVRKINIQDTCGPCNNYKGDRSADLRQDERAVMLRMYLMDFGLDPNDILEPPADVFPPKDNE